MILNPESLAKAPEAPRPNARVIPAPASSFACNFIVSSSSALIFARRLLRMRSYASARLLSIRGNRLSRERKPVAAGDAAEKNGSQNANDQEGAEHDRLCGAGDVGEAHAIAHRAKQEEREDDAQNGASAAVDVDAAENDGRDHEQDRAVGVIAARGSVLADPDERRDAGKRARQRVGLDLDAGDIDACGP